MKASVFTILFLSLTFIANAQKKAVTELGEEVILYDDGKWEYLNKSDAETYEISTNPKNFKKSKNASFLLKSTRFNIGFWVDTKKWSFKKGENNGDAEYELELKNEDLYAMVISEKVEIPLPSLKNIALETARSASPDIRIVKEEYRKVNGVTVMLLQMDGTLQGIKFTYYGYYYSNQNGTVQFVTYTAQNLIDGYKKDIEELLNGFVEM